MTTVFSHQFSSLPPGVEYIGDSSRVSIAPAPPGGPSASALKIVPVTYPWTDYGWGWQADQYIETGIRFQIPANKWYTLTFTYYAGGAIPLDLSGELSEFYGGTWVDIGLRRRRDGYTPTNTSWLVAGWEAYNYGDYEEYVWGAGWVTRSFNISPHDTDTYIEIVADWGGYWWAGDERPPPAALLEYLSGELFFANIEITEPPTQGLTTWRLDSINNMEAIEEGLSEPFVWERHWSEWQPGVDVETGWAPRYTSARAIRAENVEDTGGFAGFPYVQDKAAAEWDRVRNNSYDEVRQSTGSWNGNPIGGNRISSPSSVEAQPRWGWYSALSAIYSWHRATAGMVAYRFDARYHRKWLVAPHGTLLASAGVTQSSSGGVGTAAPIPVDLRDEPNPLEVVHTNNSPRDSGHRAYIQLDYSYDNELHEGTLQLAHYVLDESQWYPVQGWNDTSWPPNAQTAIDIGLTSPLVDLSGQQEGVSNNSTAPRIEYQVSLPGAWQQTTWPAPTSEPPKHDLLSQLTYHGETVDGEPEPTAWLLIFRSVQREGFEGAFGAEGLDGTERGNRSGGSITDGEAHTLYAEYFVRMQLTTRPWRYWMAYPTVPNPFSYANLLIDGSSRLPPLFEKIYTPGELW